MTVKETMTGYAAALPHPFSGRQLSALLKQWGSGVGIWVGIGVRVGI